MITIVGLGAGDLAQLPLGVYRLLTSAEHVFLRTEEHPVVAELAAEGLTYTAFDEVYEQHETFEGVYEAITKKLIEASKQGAVVYAVPGHPMVAERVVQLLLESDVEVDIKGGKSFLDDAFASLQIDPIEGFQLLDATDFTRSELCFHHHTIFCQVYDATVASHVKLELLEVLPHDHEVFVVTAVGSAEEVVTKVVLHELDHEASLNNLTSVYVPPVAKEALKHEFSFLREVIRTLRGPDGCPWDQAQTHESLAKNLIEETQELLEAIDGDDDENLVEELGDVLLQVVLHAQIGEDAGWFNMDDVVRGLSEKLIRRHPHVFGDVKASSPEEALAVWKKMKEEEKKSE